MKSLTRTLSMLAVGLLLLSKAGLATSSIEDRDAAVARLETHSERIERENNTPFKIGAARRSELFQSMRATRDEIDRLAAGGDVDSDRVTQLLRRERVGRMTEPETLATTATKRQTALERKLGTSFKVGQVERTRIRNEVASLDSMIVALENGQDVDDEELASLLGGMISRGPITAEERLGESRVELASRKRQLAGGMKIGSARRNEIRSEIEELDGMIGQLEAEAR